MAYGKALHTEQHGERIVVVRKDSDTDEFRARLYTYGNAKPDADYFTDDLEDAKGTARHMARCTTKGASE
jgi:hypothetical protein